MLLLDRLHDDDTLEIYTAWHSPSAIGERPGGPVAQIGEQ